MYRFRLAARITGAAALAATLVSCSDSPSAPPPPNPSLLGGVLGTVTGTVTGTTGTLTGSLSGLLDGLVACRVSETERGSATIGRYGGVVRVGPHALHVPAGALDRDVTITAVAPKGNFVKVEFQPEGLRFARATALTLSYRDCGLLGSLKYTLVHLDEDDRTVLEILPSVANLLTRSVTGRLDHFSNYAIAERRPLQ
jgi:hypothetical protein